MGAKRFALGTGLVILAVLVAVLINGYLNPSPPRPDPMLLGNRPVRTSDLPSEQRSKTESELQVRLDELLAQGSEGMKFWWGTLLTREECEEARLLALYLGDKQTATRCLCWMIRKTYSDDPGMALALLDSAVCEAEANGFDEELAQIYWQRGSVLEGIDLYERALDDYARSLAKYRELDQPDREVYLLVLLSRAHNHYLLEYETALSYQEQLVDLVGRAAPERLVPALSLWGSNLESLGRIPEAIAAYELSAECAVEAGLPGQVKNAQANMGELYLILNDPVTGRELLNQALAKDTIEKGHYFPFGPNRTLAEYMAATDDLPGAVVLLEETLGLIAGMEAGIDPATEDADYLADTLRIEKLGTYVALGDFYLGEEDYQSALDAYQQADALVDHSAEFIMPRERLEVYLAEACIGLGRYAEALPLLETARDCPSGG